MELSTNIYLTSDEGRAVFAALPILITTFDSRIMLGAETTVFIPADSDNSELFSNSPCQYPDAVSI